MKMNNMKKLWSVTVNGWGWLEPRTYYYESREEAERDAAKYPAHDPVKYAGRFNVKKADVLTGEASPWDED